jgi:hypothetical protein
LPVKPDALPIKAGLWYNARVVEAGPMDPAGGTDPRLPADGPRRHESTPRAG